MTDNFSSLKVAFVYDRVNTPYGGAENVLLALHHLFPQAPLYTSVYDAQSAPWAGVFSVRPSFLQHLPFARQHHRFFAWLMPLAFESFDLSDFEMVISITSAEAKGVITNPHQLHLCYLLTPTRYLYSHRDHYLQSLPKILRPFAKGWLQYLLWWDQVAATRPDIIIPISRLVAERTQNYYHRIPEQVIYPPVEALQPPTVVSSLLTPAPPYFMVISRLVSYKRIDLAIKACLQLNQKLVIIGEGPQQKELRKLVSPQQSELITFLGNQPADRVQQLLQTATGLLMPGQEDFGITALEAVSLGTPVIIHHQSGVAEVIPNGIGGVHLSTETVPKLINAIEHFQKISFDRAKIQLLAAPFSSQQFQDRFLSAIVQFVKDFESES